MRGSTPAGATEMPGSYAPVCAKLRAETSNIVGCVAEMCHELETAPVLRGAHSKRGTQPSQDQGTGKNIQEAAKNQGGGDLVAGGPGSVQASHVGEGTRGRDVEIETSEAAGLNEHKQLSGRGCDLVVEASTDSRVEDGAHTREGSARMQGGQTSGCDKCAEARPSTVGNRLSGDGLAGPDPYCTPLELPATPLDTSDLGYSTLKKSGEGFLGQIFEVYDKDAPVEMADISDLWYCDVFERQPSGDFDQVPRLHGISFVSSQPRRMQCDWCEMTESGESFLHSESNRLLKAMVRANTQVMLFEKDIVVPNVFDNDWGFPLCGIVPPQALKGGCGGFQHLFLPFDLVRGDDEKVSGAPSKLISTARKYFHDLQQTDVSLTRASMNIPSLWNLPISVGRLEVLASEKLEAAKLDQEVSSTSCSMSTASRSSRVTAEVPNQELVPDASKTTKNDDANSIASQAVCPLPASRKLLVAAEDCPLSTDYFLSDQFLRCNWSGPPEETATVDTLNKCSNDSEEPQGAHKLLEHIARPALWDLMRKKLLQVAGASLRNALSCITLEALEAIIYQQFRVVEKMSLNPSAFSSVEISEACASLRQAAWLHTLRMISHTSATNGEMMPAVLSRIFTSAQYKLVLGPSNWKDLQTYLKAIGGSAAPAESLVSNDLDSRAQVESTEQPLSKKQRIMGNQKETPPIRVLCSVRFLEQDELLDELCTEQQIFFIERDLPPPVDMLVDERNCVCVVTGDIIQAEANLRVFVFSLVRLQVQYRKCWLIIALDTPPSTDREAMINLLYAALVQFRVETQVFTCFSCEETACCIRAIIDHCSEVALNCHRILPRLWFERPFLLEEESQFERFFVSTKIVNHYAAQSLLHKICIDDLFLKSFDELKLLVQNAVTDEQLQLLRKFAQQDHGLHNAAQQT